MNYFQRDKMIYKPLEERISKVNIVKASLDPENLPPLSDSPTREKITQLARNILAARQRDASVMLAFGAHSIKNGLGRILSALIEGGWVTHLATNGAGVIHDWEFAFAGKSSEDVLVNASRGEFGAWEETGFYINLALVSGAWRGLGYGEAVGALICEEMLIIPPRKMLEKSLRDPSEPLWRRAAAADFLELIISEDLEQGQNTVPHLFASYSIQARAYDLGVPFTSHPMIGHDIIYTHRTSRSAPIGRCAERDFLSYVHSVSHLEGGVYMSVGSAVMSPMVFEKSLSMARNIAHQRGEVIKDCSLHVVDLAPETWDWTTGEPPEDNPAYYLRYMKTFNRMGCSVDYLSMDNQIFFPALLKILKEFSTP
jgi:hypothetical protein